MWVCHPLHQCNDVPHDQTRPPYRHQLEGLTLRNTKVVRDTSGLKLHHCCYPCSIIHPLPRSNDSFHWVLARKAQGPCFASKSCKEPLAPGQNRCADHHSSRRELLAHDKDAVRCEGLKLPDIPDEELILAPETQTAINKQMLPQEWYPVSDSQNRLFVDTEFFIVPATLTSPTRHFPCTFTISDGQSVLLHCRLDHSK